MSFYYMPNFKKKILEILFELFILRSLCLNFKSQSLRIFTCKPLKTSVSSSYWNHETLYFKLQIFVWNKIHFWACHCSAGSSSLTLLCKISKNSGGNNNKKRLLTEMGMASCKEQMRILEMYLLKSLFLATKKINDLHWELSSHLSFLLYWSLFWVKLTHEHMVQSPQLNKEFKDLLSFQDVSEIKDRGGLFDKNPQSDHPSSSMI